jgi:hypothetical protein
MLEAEPGVFMVADDPLTVEAIKAGAVEFLTKPFRVWLRRGLLRGPTATAEAPRCASKPPADEKKNGLLHSGRRDLTAEQRVYAQPRERVSVWPRTLNAQIGLADVIGTIDATMILAAARALAESSPTRQDASALLLPAVTDLWQVAVHIATTVGLEVQRAGAAPKTTEDELRQRVMATQWTPAYPSFATTTMEDRWGWRT